MGRGRGRAPCCDKNKVKRGPWSPAEDMKLAAFILHNGHKNWRTLPKQAGLLRCGKSCRLRWINYLTPSVKRGNFTLEEEETIIKLHDSYGNRWSKIAAELPGRTDNEIKNVWNTHLKKRLLGKNSKCHNNNTEAIKNDECSSSIVISSSSLSTSSATLSTCGDVPSPQANRLLTADRCPVDTLPEILPAQISPDIDKRETSGSSSFSSNASEFSSSANEAPNIHHLKQSNNVDIVDSEFDIWTVLEDFEKFETKQEQQLVPSHLQASSFGDHENYIINHDMELAENGFNDEEMMSLEPEIDPGMVNFQYWPPSPYNI